LGTKSLFSRSEFRVSKYLFGFVIKKDQVNQPHYDTLTITNSWNSKASFSFVNNYYFSSDVFASFFPTSGEIEKGKSVTITVGCVAYGKVKLNEIFYLDLKGTKYPLKLLANYSQLR
jgi:hypothetical protein